jgi:ABC-type nitrate/sulfonate/bicarbonate transport system permease component
VSTRRIVLAGLLGVVVFGLLWEAYVRLFDVERFILLAPSTIIREIAEHPRFYFDAALVTAWHAVAGIAISLVVAVLLGAVLASSRFLEQAAQPVLIGVLVAPWIAYFSSIVLWLGSGDLPVIFLVAVVTTPAFVFAAVAGMRSADPAARELLASVDARRLEVLWRLRLPSALPTIFAAARFNLGLALAASYYGEGGNLTNSGLGAAGRRAIGQNADALWATILMMVVVGAVLLGLLSLLERLALRWHVSQRIRSRAT